MYSTVAVVAPSSRMPGAHEFSPTVLPVTTSPTTTVARMPPCVSAASMSPATVTSWAPASTSTPLPSSLLTLLRVIDTSEEEPSTRNDPVVPYRPAEPDGDGHDLRGQPDPV